MGNSEVIRARLDEMAPQDALETGRMLRERTAALRAVLDMIDASETAIRPFRPFYNFVHVDDIRRVISEKLDIE